LPRKAPWPRQPLLLTAGTAITLPVPAKNIFEIQERPCAATQAVVPSTHHAERLAPAGNGTDLIAKLISVDAGASRRMIPGSVPVTEPGLKPVPLTAR
jgi:hypothetical protein